MKEMIEAAEAGANRKMGIITIETVGEVIELEGTKYKSFPCDDPDDPCRGCAFGHTRSGGNKVCGVVGVVRCIYNTGDVIFKRVEGDPEESERATNKKLAEKDVKDIAALMNERDFARCSIDLLKEFRKMPRVTISTEAHTKMVELTCETKNAFIDDGVQIMEERIAELNLKIQSYGITE